MAPAVPAQFSAQPEPDISAEPEPAADDFPPL
jgi:hypothetical protein